MMPTDPQETGDRVWLCCKIITDHKLTADLRANGTTGPIRILEHDLEGARFKVVIGSDQAWEAGPVPCGHILVIDPDTPEADIRAAAALVGTTWTPNPTLGDEPLDTT